jgi:hypothetical protein
VVVAPEIAYEILCWFSHGVPLTVIAARLHLDYAEVTAVIAGRR